MDEHGSNDEGEEHMLVEGEHSDSSSDRSQYYELDDDNPLAIVMALPPEEGEGEGLMVAQPLEGGAPEADAEPQPVPEPQQNSDAESTDEETAEYFDISLAASHSYMGESMQPLSGRSVLEAGWTGLVPVLAHHGAVFPGETVPMLLQHADDAAILSQAIDQDKLFGLLCPDESGTMVSGYGVLCEVYEASLGEPPPPSPPSPRDRTPPGLTFKARASHRFRFVDMPKRSIPMHLYSRMRFQKIVVLPEIQPGDPLQHTRLLSLDPLRRGRTPRMRSVIQEYFKAIMLCWTGVIQEYFKAIMLCKCSVVTVTPALGWTGVIQEYFKAIMLCKCSVVTVTPALGWTGVIQEYFKAIMLCKCSVVTVTPALGWTGVIQEYFKAIMLCKCSVVTVTPALGWTGVIQEYFKAIMLCKCSVVTVTPALGWTGVIQEYFKAIMLCKCSVVTVTPALGWTGVIQEYFKAIMLCKCSVVTVTPALGWTGVIQEYFKAIMLCKCSVVTVTPALGWTGVIQEYFKAIMLCKCSVVTVTPALGWTGVIQEYFKAIMLCKCSVVTVTPALGWTGVIQEYFKAIMLCKCSVVTVTPALGWTGVIQEYFKAIMLCWTGVIQEYFKAIMLCKCSVVTVTPALGWTGVIQEYFKAIMLCKCSVVTVTPALGWTGVIQEYFKAIMLCWTGVIQEYFKAIMLCNCSVVTVTPALGWTGVIQEYFKAIMLSDKLPEEPVSLSFWVARNLALTPRDRLALFVVDNALLRLHMAVKDITRKSVLCCATCANEIARRDHIFAMSSEGVHSNYTNLGGYMHDIVTVSRAVNIELTGAPSAEYSWFPGYTWTIAVCSACMAHVGWRFDAMRKSLRPTQFYGLPIVDCNKQDVFNNAQFYGLCRNYVVPRAADAAPLPPLAPFLTHPRPHVTINERV
ncbi:yippee zinc-binding/DNA-binding /Mis18, centromere assembly domain-containing protein [Phthorimaea operculella]|nr:yippee zinc-binding/DNA-binding /Mis18, centromere assembly domain-containing protein [Phthorimaea operculella]